jgi:dihydrofolate reductase
MRTVTASFFISLDGIVDAPQDWHFPYATPELTEVVEEATRGVDALLMGRRTYEEWQAFWPTQAGYPLAEFINGTHKYVASRSLSRLDWGPATLLSRDVVDRVAALKEEAGGAIAVNGSGTLTRHLLRAGLVDELHLLVHPVVVGTGKHLFEEGAETVPLALASHRTFANGVTHQVYRPAASTAAA